LFFQALLFIIGHLYHLYSGNLYSFFIIVPIGGLLFGFIAYRSKSIGNSMIRHGLLNALSVIIAFRGWM
jgi:membrane protease YdiL (CAAX protease family)